MNVLFILAISVTLFYLAGKVYSRYISRILGEDPSNPTPAVTINDGRDYVPTKRYVVFAHHFSSIAGAGPIIGPTMAILYGLVPAWLWIVFGGIFIGAVHDFTSLFLSMREGGKSMAEVARKTLGNTGFKLFISFSIMMLILITSSFLSATAISLTSVWPLSKLGVSVSNTMLHTVTTNGVTYGRIGGIASTSVIFITAMSPLLGWLIFKKSINIIISYIIASLICIASILLGIYFPVSLSPFIWMIIISIYVFIAAGTPVWAILQPRDFINVQILYAGIILMVLSLLLTGFRGVHITMPNFNVADGTKSLGLIWPMLFITIACGAISGFHSLVAGGTTSKQLSNEADARKIGFNAMLLESVLAVCVLLSIGIGLSFFDYKSIVWPINAGVKSNPILGFSLAAGHLFNQGLGIPISLGTVFGILLVEGFVITTLDASIRLNRYLFEELWTILFKNTPNLLKKYWFNSGLAVSLMMLLGYSNAFSVLWPIFGTANQLLAALGLLTVSSWLLIKGKKYFFALYPALFMIVTTITSLIILLGNYIQTKNYILILVDILMIALSIGVIIMVIKTFIKPDKRKAIILQESVQESLAP
ncbi:MAG TPA: carbon starvation CstA family protein [Ignavibacteriaceae bacterium]|nr:carbon starvation CstA family protein [Ignavibacteriaceae bacterium]